MALNLTRLPFTLLLDFMYSMKKQNGLSGTPYWMAPEYLSGKTEYTTCCDIYAFGEHIFVVFL
jgi:serine/threonine protein kinase